MSDSLPGVSVGYEPTGAWEVPHSDLVAGLFREILSRSNPVSTLGIPDSGFTPPTAGSAEALAGQAGLDVSTPSLVSPGVGSENLQKSAPDQTSAPFGLSPLQSVEISPTSQTEESLDVLSLADGNLADAAKSPLNPPPIHSESPSAISLVEEESKEPEESTRQDLPFGQPPGPELVVGKPITSRNSSGIEVLSEYSTSTPTPGVLESPDYYFLSKAPDPEVAVPAGGHEVPVPPFDLESVRNDFPALNQQSNGHPLVYLDNAATTQKPQTVIDATSEFYAKDNANIHRAAYELAERATAAFEGAREKVRRFLGAREKKEIVFVRGTTEAINLLANTFGRKYIGNGDEILLTTLEHHANIVPWQLLAKQVGAVIKVVPINERGELILEEYVRLLSPRTKLVSVTQVSNSLGTVNPVEQIIQLAHARGVHVLVDGAQSTPHLPVNVQALDADFFVFSGHKVFGPTGIGALYGKAHLLETLPPWQGGGHMIRDVTFERTIFQNAPEKFEAGTPDIAGAVGLGAAIDYLFKIGIPQIASYEHALLEYATERLYEVPGIRLIGTAASKASVLSFVIPGIPNESVASHLDKRGIAVRAGHHCALPTIRHFGLESSVRPSLAFYNNRQDVDALILGLHSLIQKRP